MRRPERSKASGQALLETALILPLLFVLLLNVINFGYIFVVGLNLAAAPRSGALYSIMGFSTPGTLALPAAGPPATNSTISYLTYNDITGALWNPGGDRPDLHQENWYSRRRYVQLCYLLRRDV